MFINGIVKYASKMSAKKDALGLISKRIIYSILSILWFIYPLLSNDRETSSYTRAVTRKRERESGGRVVRDTTLRGVKKNISSVLKVPRQCPLVLLVGAMHQN
jgi:hypothetical protein